MKKIVTSALLHRSTASGFLIFEPTGNGRGHRGDAGRDAAGADRRRPHRDGGGDHGAAHAQRGGVRVEVGSNSELDRTFT